MVQVVWRYLNRHLLLLIATFILLVASTGLITALVEQHLLIGILSVVLLIVAITLFIAAPRIEARLMVERARSLILNSQFSSALALLNRAVEFAPRLASAYSTRCAAYAGLGQIDLAMDDADRAVKLAPHKPEVLLVRARLYSHRGLHEDTIRDLKVGIIANPNWTTGYMELIQIYVGLHDYESALTLLRDLSAAHFSDQIRYDSLVLSGWVYEEKLQDLDRAIVAYTRAIPLLPDRKIGYLRRAHAYHKRGDHFQAAEDLLRAARRMPTREDTGQYYWIQAACYWARYTITDDQSDFKAWVAALEQSIVEDAPAFSTQAKEWLKALREQRLNQETVQSAMPSMIQIFPN